MGLSVAKSYSPNERVQGKESQRVKSNEVEKGKVERQGEQYGRGVNEEVQRAGGKGENKQNLFLV